MLGLFLTAGVGRGVVEQRASLVSVSLLLRGCLDSQFAIGVVLRALADPREQPQSQLSRRSILALRPDKVDGPGVLIGNRCIAGSAAKPDQDGSELPPSSLETFCEGSLR